MRHPLVEQYERLLAVAHRPEHQGAGRGQVGEQVVAALPVGGQALVVPAGHQLAAQQRPAPAQRLGRHCAGLVDRRVVDAELAVPPGDRGRDARRPEVEHPAQVDRGHQVQGAAHRPGPDHLAGVERRVHRCDV